MGSSSSAFGISWSALIFPSVLAISPLRRGFRSCKRIALRRYKLVMSVTLRGITHLPNFELIGGDVVECRLLLLLNCFLQVIDGFR